MYAVVDIGGKQWKVAKSDTIRVPTLDSAAEKTVSFNQVLLVVDKEKVTIGKPYIRDAKVQCTVLNHGKGDKVKVFKKKRRKDYQVLKGHRQGYTEIRVDKIQIGKTTKTEKSAPAPKPAAKASAPAGPVKKKAPASAAKTAQKTPGTAKKATPAAKKPDAAKKPAAAKPKPSASSKGEVKKDTKTPSKTTKTKTSRTKKED